ncbi:molecular chaperone HtpG, partial [Nguyenibacter vanlangensis]|nr:molecular chaperone HtpG [Nguyenibacter vanlangensis]
GPDLQLQRLLRRSGQAVPDLAPVLEINAAHPLIRDLAARVARDEAIDDVALILLDVARIQDGESPKDPAGFASRLTATLARAGV